MKFKLYVLFVFKSVFCLINLDDLISIDNDKRIDITSKDSLLEGLLLYETDTLHNLRFYNPFVDRSFENDHSQWYKANPQTDLQELTKGDTSLNQKKQKSLITYYEITYLLFRLFPSPNAYLCTLTEAKSNLEFTLSSKLKDENIKNRDDLKILAAVLFCINYKIEGFFSSEVKIAKKNIHLARNLKFRADSLNLDIELNYSEMKSIFIDNIILNQLNILLLADAEQVHYLYSPSIIFKAFLCFYIKSYDELLIFYDFYSKILIESKIPYVYEHKGYLKNVLKEIYINESVFPYRMNSTPTGVIVPYYLENKKFKKNTEFSNCVESALYHFCNCILWDADDKKYLDTVNSSLVSQHVFNGSKKGMPDYNEMKLWHSLIENLPNGVSVKELKNGNYSLNSLHNKIIYKLDCSYENNKKALNEIKSSFLNFINVLDAITGSKGDLISKYHSFFIKDENGTITDMNIKQINNYLKDVIEKIVGKEKIKYFTIESKDAEIYDIHNTKDVRGTFTISRHYPKNNLEIKFTLSISSGHTYIVVNEFSGLKNKIIIEDKYLNDLGIDFKNLLCVRFNQYIEEKNKYSEPEDKILLSNPFNMLCYFQLGRLDNIENIKVLNRLINIYLDKVHTKDIRDMIINIFVNLLKSMRLEDQASLEEYFIFLLFFSNNFEFNSNMIKENIHTNFGKNEKIEHFDIEFDKIVNEAFSYNLKTTNIIDFNKPRHNPKIAKLMSHLEKVKNKINHQFIQVYKKELQYNQEAMSYYCKNLCNFIIAYNFFKMAKIEKRVITKNNYYFLLNVFTNSSDYKFMKVYNPIISFTKYTTNDKKISNILIFLAVMHIYRLDLNERNKIEYIPGIDKSNGNFIIRNMLSTNNVFIYTSLSAFLEFYLDKITLLKDKNKYMKLYLENIKYWYACIENNMNSNSEILFEDLFKYINSHLKSDLIDKKDSILLLNVLEKYLLFQDYIKKNRLFSLTSENNISEKIKLIIKLVLRYYFDNYESVETAILSNLNSRSTTNNRLYENFIKVIEIICDDYSDGNSTYYKLFLTINQVINKIRIMLQQIK